MEALSPDFWGKVPVNGDEVELTHALEFHPVLLTLPSKKGPVQVMRVELTLMQKIIEEVKPLNTRFDYSSPSGQKYEGVEGKVSPELTFGVYRENTTGKVVSGFHYKPPESK